MTKTPSESGQVPAGDTPGTLLSGVGGLDLFLRHRSTCGAGRGAPPAVLYVHGATFPSALSVGYRLDGRSWVDDLSATGFDVWAFDFAGFGSSARYPRQDREPAGLAPLGRAPEAAPQLLQVLEHVVEARGGGRVSLLAHSWGTIVAGLAATCRPELVDRLVLFGPITRRTLAGLPDPASLGGWYPLTVHAQYDRFVEDVPAGQPRVLTEQFQQWAEDWLATDPTSHSRTPPSVRTPSGPLADIIAAWSGQLAYDPGLIEAPTCIVRGEWDSLCTDDDARALFDALTGAPLRRDVKISGGTHLLHLESGRRALYREAATFLLGADSPPSR
ncbi:MAG: alpha/beta fold hydrolase [Mycobacteriales bacterium]